MSHSPGLATQTPVMLPYELTLIVAATRSMGIGRGGTLPWPSLKQEMAYFARVTKGIPKSFLTNTGSIDSQSSPAVILSLSARTWAECGATLPDDHPADRVPFKVQNAVLMGRKTYASIPPRFRPLKDRFNIVITRSVSRPQLVPASSFDLATPITTTTSQQPSTTTEPMILQAPSIESALAYLQQQQQSSIISQIARLFIIGGGELYRAALEMQETKRVLLTKIETDFECDTFFPDLEASGTQWADKGDEALKEWAGEAGIDVKTGRQEEGNVGYKFCLYERV